MENNSAAFCADHQIEDDCIRFEHWTVFGEVTGMLFLACAGESAGLWDAEVGGNELLVLQDQILSRRSCEF